MGRGVRHLWARARARARAIVRRQSIDDPMSDGVRRMLGSDEELDRFLNRSARYPRAVTGRAAGRSTPRWLGNVIGPEIRRLAWARTGRWTGFAIAVEQDDGMTWSAATTYRLIGECAPIPRRQLLPQPRLDGLPQIVELIPKRRLIAFARQAGVVRGLPLLGRPSLAIAILGVMLVGAVTAVLQVLTSTANGVDPIVPIIGAVVAALALFGQRLAAQLGGADREARDGLARDLEEARQQRTSAWSALVEALSEELARTERDRAVVVDDFDRLDGITRHTLLHYMTHRSRPAHAHELWVIFERAESASLSNAVDALANRAPSSRRVRLKTLRQLTLHERARHELAAEVGNQEGADFHLVKSVVGQKSDVGEVYRDMFDGLHAVQRHAPNVFGPLKLSHLLSVQQGTGPFGFREGDLVSDLSSEGSEAHLQVLRQVVPGASFGLREVKDAVEGLKEDLHRVLDTRRAAVGEIEVVSEAAAVLVERRGRYGLPSEDIVHLFWALYIYSKLRGVPDRDAYLLRKLGRHLVLAAAPELYGDELGSEVRTELGNALVWAAQALLAVSVPDDVRALLLRAERESDHSSGAGRLRTVCWQAYAVLGDEDLLAIILRLHRGATAIPPAATEPESLFVESLRSVSHVSEVRQELAQRLMTLDPEIRAYARVRGLWLALTVDPVAVGSWSRFSSVSVDAADRVTAVLREALHLIGDPRRPRVVIAALTASVGIWCYGLAFRRGSRSLAEANDVFDEVRQRTAGLHEFLDERRQGGSEDYVLRCAAQELETVCGAAALMIGMSGAAAEPSKREIARLQDHMRGGPGGGGAATRVQVGGMVRRMTLQELAWRTLGSSSRNPLGFDQLAAFMALRRVHLSLLVGRGDGTAGRSIADLAKFVDEPGVVGLMAYAIAMRGSSSAEIGAHLWAEAARVARSSGFDGDMEMEVCLCALARGHAFGSIEKAPVVGALLGRNGNGDDGSSLADRLDELGEDRSDAALWLLNAARQDDVTPDLVEALVSHVAAMRDRTEDEQLKNEIQELIELFELDRSDGEVFPVPVAETLARWRGRLDSSHYPWMLCLLIRHFGPNVQAIEAATSYLRLHPEVPPMWGPVILALEVVRSESRGDASHSVSCHRVALEYLGRVHRSMEDRLDVETNIDILEKLIRRSIGDLGRHHAMRERWEVTRQERAGVGKLRHLAAAGKFFHVLWHYFETLWVYGLRTETSLHPGELLLKEGEARALAEWQEGGELVPGAIVHDRGGMVLSTAFLRYGLALFGLGAEDNDLDDAREMFSAAALDALPALFRQMKALDELPDRIRRLLVDHESQISRSARAWAASR